MTNTQPARNCAIGQLPSQPVDRDHNLGRPILECHMTMPAGQASAEPQPARFGFLHARPESMCKRLTAIVSRYIAAWPILLVDRINKRTAATSTGDHGRMRVHDEPPIRCAMPRAVSAAPWLSLACIIPQMEVA
jgi:hypothetical protein